MTPVELLVVSAQSRLWTGPFAWGYVDGYKLDLSSALELPGGAGFT